MKSLMRLLLCVLDDSSTWCCTSTTRDFEEISRRVENEGFSFLTITLPAFGQDFERSLDSGYLRADLFRGFKRLRGTPCPALLSGLMGLVFDAKTGMLLDHPSIDAIFYIRQLCYMFKKVLLPCTENRIEAAYARFIQCEQEVLSDLDELGDERLNTFRHLSNILWSSTLGPVNRKVIGRELLPKHGPGATAERISGNRKYDLVTWHERLEPFFPASDFAIPNFGFAEQLERMDFFEPGQEPPVRVITVPKTLKTPRIIAIEPVCMQYTQQALLEPIVAALESARLTAGHLNFTDQTVNQRLALASSKSTRLATIDMKDASDRVSCSLVYEMLSCVPDLRDAVMACRSTSAAVPGKGVVPLAKFASMGSALCFPIESMVFYAICILGMAKGQACQISTNSVFRLSRGVHVYGDDIIVPVDMVPFVVSELEAFGLKVNQHKSFWTGKFRESCGVDAYDGVQVTPVYVRRLLPTSRRDVPEMLSAISLRNQLYKAGMWKTCQWLTDYVGRYAPLPIVSETSPIHGLHSFVFEPESQRMCKNLHKPLAFGISTSVRHRRSQVDGPGALLKVFLKRGSLPIHDAKHLERHGRPESVNIKLRWLPSA